MTNTCSHTIGSPCDEIYSKTFKKERALAQDCDTESLRNKYPPRKTEFDILGNKIPCSSPLRSSSVPSRQAFFLGGILRVTAVPVSCPPPSRPLPSRRVVFP